MAEDIQATVRSDAGEGRLSAHPQTLQAFSAYEEAGGIGGIQPSSGALGTRGRGVSSHARPSPRIAPPAPMPSDRLVANTEVYTHYGINDMVETATEARRFKR